MRIGVVSDTHDNLDNVDQIIEIFNRAAVERVVHAGDITQPRTLHRLGGLQAPLFGVWGNNDLEREALERTAASRGFCFADPPMRIHWAGRRIVVVHDQTEHDPAVLHSGDALLLGHDHVRRIERRNGTLLLNPGECAGQLRGHNAVAILDLETLKPEIVLF